MPISQSISEAGSEQWLKDIIKSMAERSEAIRKSPYQPYKLERLAPINKDLERAYELGRITGDYQPYLDLAHKNTMKGSEEFPEHVQRYMNPYQQNVIDNLMHYSGRNLREQTLPALESQFVGLGQHGSTQHQTMAQRAARDAQEALNRQIGEQLSHGYETSGKLFNADAARALEAAELGPKIAVGQQAGRLSDISTLGQVGEFRRADEQAKHDLDYEEYQRENAYPYESLKEQAGVLQGYYTPPQSTYTATQTQGTPQPNTLANLGSLATGLYGLNMAYGQRKAGGHIKKYAPGGMVNPALLNFKPRQPPTLPNMKNHSFTETSMYKQPKVGGVYSMNKSGGFR